MTNIDQSKLRSVQFLLENNFSEAIKELDKVIEMDPADSVSWHNRGASKFNLDQFKEAIPDFDKAIELNPNDVNCLSLRASAKRKLGDNKLSDEDDKKAEKLKNNL